MIEKANWSDHGQVRYEFGAREARFGFSVLLHFEVSDGYDDDKDEANQGDWYGDEADDKIALPSRIKRLQATRYG